MTKNIMVTGTSRGIGLELVREFAKAGHSVMALSRNIRPVVDLALPSVHPFSIDITQPETYPEINEFIEQEWEQKVDILIHNAGKIVKKDFINLSPQELREIYETNVFGVFELTQNTMPYLTEKSHVVVISSMGGVQGSVKFPGLSAYSSSKAAVLNLVELWAEEFKNTGPIFNALALGAVQTEMFEAAFPGVQAGMQPEQMARYIARFAVEGSEVYNGKILHVSNSTP